MGLLDGIFGSFEKLEAQGDEALAAERPLDAYERFREAQRKAHKKDPIAAERLGAKAARARDQFVRAKIASARQYLDDELPDVALEELQIARQHLAERDSHHHQQIAELAAAAEEMLEPGRRDAAAAEEARIRAAAGRPAQLVGEASAEDTLQDAAEEVDLPALFEQVMGVLSAEDQARAPQLGEAFQRGFIAQQLDQHDEALQALRQAAEQHPEDPLVLEQLAITLDQQGQTADAEACYKRALEVAPQRINARLALAGILAGAPPHAGVQTFYGWYRAAEATDQTPRLSEALALLEEGSRIDPEQSAAYLAGAAQLSLACRRPAAAVGLITRAMEQGPPDQAHDLHLYAVASEMNGDLDDAEDAYERAVRVGGHAMFYRAEFAEFALRHRRKLKDAGEMIFETCVGCQASQASPEDLEYYGFLLSRIQHARGQYREALDGVDRLLEQAPPEPLLGHLGLLRRQIKADLAAKAAAGGAEDEADEEKAENTARPADERDGSTGGRDN